MRNINSPSSIHTSSSPDSTQDTVAESAQAVDVDIFNVHYTVKPPENLTADEIRKLANYIDGLMRRLGSGQGTNDPLSRAILVALNLASQMSSSQVDSEAEIHRIIAKLDQVLNQ